MKKSNLNLPNIISLSRAPFLFIIVALLYAPFRYGPTLAFIFFVFGSLSDWLDGFLARRYNMVSDFGRLMDALMDKVYVVGSCVAMMGVDILPNWAIFLVLLIICREFFVTGLRLVAASQGRVLEAEKLGKLKTVIQMFSIGLMLLWKVFNHDFYDHISFRMAHNFYDLGMVLFTFAAFMTVYSGAVYIKKYGDLLR